MSESNYPNLHRNMLISSFFGSMYMSDQFKLSNPLSSIRYYNKSAFILFTMSSPCQMFSCVDADAILKSPINDSPSKTHWSFAKDSRFKRPKFYCDSFYNIPGVAENKNRRAGIGYDLKTNLDIGKHPHNIVPSPDTYNLASFVELNETHKKGFSPLFSRQEIAPMSYIDLEQKKVPGPGRYEQHRVNDTPKWSMRPKVDDDLFPKTTALIVPAPCTYNNSEEIGRNPSGKYHLSKYPSSRAKSFNPPRSRRFYKSSTDVPAPNIYNPQNNLSNEGKYVLSKNVSAGKRTFMDGRRHSFTDLIAKRSTTPGPGSYRSPSDFGHYDSRRERESRLGKSQVLSRSKGIQRSGQTAATDRK